MTSVQQLKLGSNWVMHSDNDCNRKMRLEALDTPGQVADFSSLKCCGGTLKSGTCQRNLHELKQRCNEEWTEILQPSETLMVRRETIISFAAKGGLLNRL